MIKQPTILLVEDEPAHAEMVIRNFSAEDHELRLIHVENGQHALDYLFNRDAYADAQAYPRPVLVLLDLRLPRVSGLEVLEVIKKDPERCLIPVVILSTSDAEHDIRKAYQLQANSYLTKPFEYAAFAKMMKAVREYWLDCNQTCKTMVL